MRQRQDDVDEPDKIRSLAKHTWKNEMRTLIILALAAAVTFTGPETALGQTPNQLSINCESGAFSARHDPPNLHGEWDFLMVPRGQLSFGLMTIGFVGADYGGSLSLARTAPVVLRSITFDGEHVQMVVASREGDVFFNGRLSAKGDFMCGAVTYHGGETFPMVAQKRPTSYQSPPQAER